MNGGKTKIGIIICIIIIIIESGFLIYLTSSNISQKNQIDMIFKKQKVVKISEKPTIYICKSDNAEEDFIKFMETEGWKERDQMSYEFYFIKNGEVRGYNESFEKDLVIWTFDYKNVIK